MKIVANTKLINRNKKIASYTMLAALVVLGVGLYFSFQPALFSYSIFALIAGFLVSQFGMYFTNRWGRSPRPDEVLTSSLKGLDDRYTLYHFTGPVPHMLVGPSGVWVLQPYFQRGKIVYTKNRWRQTGGGIGLAYMKLFGQEGLGRPDLEVKSSIDDVNKFLHKELSEETSVPVNAVLVFTHPQVEVDAPDAPIATLKADKLKDYIRKRQKELSKDFPVEVMKQVTTVLPEPTESA